MPRNRHKRKTESPIAQPLAPTPAAQALIDRVIAGGQEYIKENFEHIMLESFELADEPEFEEILLNPENVVGVTARWMEKYEQRLEAARQRGEDEFEQAFDDMRIKAIDELITPGFRGLIDQRLRAFFERCAATGDLQKLEIALLLGPVLQAKDFPWGVCGLIIAIYSRTMDQAMAEVQVEQDMYNAMTEAVKEEFKEKDPQELAEILNSPEKMDEIGEKVIANNPQLREKTQKQLMELLDAFETDLMAGRIRLNLFSDEELFLPFQRIADELGMPFEEAESSKEKTERLFEVTRQAISEIMTPERYQRMRNLMHSTAQAWLRENKKWARALRIELEELDEEKYEESQFIWAAFFGQINQLSREERSASQKHKKRKR
jgi:hypothetical protein